jgi:biotin synthase
VPLNFLNPRPGTPLAGRPRLGAPDALRTIAAFRLALPRAVLRYAGGRELTLGDLGTEAGMLGGINAIIVGNYLTTLGRSAQADLEMLGRLRMPIKALSGTL